MVEAASGGWEQDCQLEALNRLQKGTDRNLKKFKKETSKALHRECKTAVVQESAWLARAPPKRYLGILVDKFSVNKRGGGKLH